MVVGGVDQFVFLHVIWCGLEYQAQGMHAQLTNSRAPSTCVRATCVPRCVDLD